MDVYGQLVKAQLEELASAAPSPSARSRLYADITDTSNVVPRFYNGTGWVPLSTEKYVTRTVTTTATLAETDRILYCSASGGAFTVTLPAASTVSGRIFRIWKTDSTFSAVTIDGAGAELVQGAATIKLCTRDEWVDIISTGTAWTIVGHDFYRGKTAWTPTGAWSTNTTYTAYWWRRGNHFCSEILIALAGAPTAASLTVNFPTGVTVDTAQMAKVEAAISAWPGRVQIRDAGTEIYTGILLYSSTSAFAVFKDDGDGTQSTVNATAPMTFANTDYIHIFIQDVPATDWIAA